MKKSKKLQQAMVASLLSMLLCVSMLVGSTFAWFTDTVSSGVNTIMAGNLDVVLEYWDGDSWEDVTTSTKLFDDAAKWEPGHTEVAYLKVSNAGTLALKYQLNAIVSNEEGGISVENDKPFKLSEYIKFGRFDSDSEITPYATRKEAVNAVEDKAGPLASFTKEAELLNQEEVDYVALVLFMPEDTGNEANYKHGTTPPSVNFGIELFATQVENEDDSFGNDYDKPAPLPIIPENIDETLNDTVGADGKTITSQDGKVTVTIPAGTFTEDTNVIIDIETTNAAADTATYNIDVTVGEGEELPEGKPIQVELSLNKGLESVNVTHNPGEDEESFNPVDSLANLTDGTFFYDKNTGKLTVCSDSFSPYKIDFVTPDYEAAIGDEVYLNFEDAVAAAAAGATVTLMKNVEDGVGVVIDKNITIDFNGHTYVANEPYVGSEGTETLGFQLLKDNAVTFKNGKLTMDAGRATILIQNYSNLTLEKMEIVAGENTYAVSINNGTVSITNCVITGEGTEYAALDVMHWADGGYTTPPSVTINNTTIQGEVEVYCANGDECLPTVKYDKSTVPVTPDSLDTVIKNTSTEADIVLSKGNYTLPSIPNKDVNITGTADTVIDLSNGVTASGSTVTFDGITVSVTGDGTYKGIQHAEKVVYKNATLNGTQFLYSDAEFTDCTFNVSGDAYNIWTYGNDVIFTNCTFNCDGKAVLVYHEGAVTATVTLNDCTFNDSDENTEVTDKAAVEVGESAYENKATYTINMNNCTVNGFSVNAEQSTEPKSTAWGNKNNMPADRLHIFINGKEVY